jgi:hypothetical protein
MEEKERKSGTNERKCLRNFRSRLYSKPTYIYVYNPTKTSRIYTPPPPPPVNMADVQNPDLGVASAELGEENCWFSGLCAGLLCLCMSSFLAFLLFGASLLHGTSKAVHALGALGFAVGILLTLLCGAGWCADAIAKCIYGEDEGKQQEEVLPHVQPQ